MAELILKDVDSVLLRELQELAERHGRTAAEQAKVILAGAVRGERGGDWAAVDAIYDRLAAAGKTFSDSADLLREDRDR
jgi:hypothetical protein